MVTKRTVHDQTGSYGVITDDDGCECGRCRYVEPEPGLWGLSKDTWAKLVIWLVPIIFASGTLYYNFQSMSAKVDGNVESIKGMDERQQDMQTKQTVQATKLDAIREAQGELKKKVDAVGEKLNEQSDDLSAIKTKLGVRRRSRSR